MFSLPGDNVKIHNISTEKSHMLGHKRVRLVNPVMNNFGVSLSGFFKDTISSQVRFLQ